MVRPVLAVVLPDHLAVRPVHREGRRLAAHRVRPEEDHQRQEARRPGQKALRWGVESLVRIRG